MGSFRNPVGPPDPFDKYRVEEVGDKQAKRDLPEDREEEHLPENHGWLAAYLIQTLQKMVNFFLERYAKGKVEGTGAKENLQSLKKCFEILKNEDRSEDVNFLNHLAKNWNQAVEDSFHFDKETVSSKFRELVKKILHYPENQTHTFGYYLTEYAGQKWVPFPYMELIAKIHFEHKKNPLSSALTEWTLLLDEVLEAMK
jgi:hypothetical protein